MSFRFLIFLCKRKAFGQLLTPLRDPLDDAESTEEVDREQDFLIVDEDDVSIALISATNCFNGRSELSFKVLAVIVFSCFVLL